jgi:hypothetical protein
MDQNTQNNNSLLQKISSNHISDNMHDLRLHRYRTHRWFKFPRLIERNEASSGYITVSTFIIRW